MGRISLIFEYSTHKFFLIINNTTNMRSSIYHDNINNVSRISANFFNRYTHQHIIYWCQLNHIIANNSMNILNPQSRDFQRFIDAVTSQNVDPTQITLIPNIQTYQQNLSVLSVNLKTFMEFVLGLTYLLVPEKFPNSLN